jgi:hypothetical protein
LIAQVGPLIVFWLLARHGLVHLVHTHAQELEPGGVEGNFALLLSRPPKEADVGHAAYPAAGGALSEPAWCAARWASYFFPYHAGRERTGKSPQAG